MIVKKQTKLEKEATSFAEFLANNRWYRNGITNEWYQIPKQNVNKTISELYQLFLESCKKN